MKFNQGLFLLGTIIFLITSCSNDNEDPFLLYDVDDEFTITFEEAFSIQKRELVFDVQSILGYDCPDLQIDISYSRSGNEIFITINDILNYSNCSEGNHPANGSINIGELSEGNYILHLNLRDVVMNTGLLKVSSTGYLFQNTNEGGELIGLEMDFNQLNRMPDGVLWGRVEYHSSDDFNLYKDFLEDLEDVGAVQTQIQEGEYGSFNINPLGEMIWRDFSSFEFSQSFLFMMNEVEEIQLETLVQAFLSENGTEADIDLFTSNGGEY